MHAYNNPSSGEHEGRVVTEVTVTASVGKKKKKKVKYMFRGILCLKNKAQ